MDMIITTPNELEITMTRAFNAARELVFDCWTKPELLKRWMLGFDGTTFVVCEIDLRVGGTYRYVWRNPDGSTMGMKGTYREVLIPARIINTQRFDQDWTGGETIGTLLFTERNNITTTINTVRYASKEARDAALQSGMEHGMSAGYDRLEELLARQKETA
jgi:uncharacterized protein YndB with AHSA1/START domain